MIRSLALASLTAIAISAAPASAAVAPGRVVFSVATQIPETNVDAGGAGPAVALPDGGTVIVADTRAVGLTLIQLRADGSPDPSFGSGGIARIALAGPFLPNQLLRRPDGRLLVAGTTSAATRFQFPRIVVIGLTAAGALDTSFGSAGHVTLELQGSCVTCEPVALAPDGSLVVTGNTGEQSPALPTNPEARSTRRWVVQRLTPTGAPDASFGSVVVSAAGTAGYSTVVRPSGAIVVLGIIGGKPVLAGLTAAGAPDPSFNGGQPLAVPVDNALTMLQHAGGAIEVAGNERLARFTSAGALDAGFGAGGTASFSGFNRSYGPPSSFAAPDGGTVLYGKTIFEPTPAGRPRIHIQRIAPSGALGSAGDLEPAFGGGIAGVRLAQNGFRGSLLPRANGSYLAVGGVSVVQYTGEGEGRSAGFVAVAAYSPTLVPDAAFGGAQQPADARLTVPRQHARTDAARRRVLARVTTSGAGLVRLRVRDDRGRTLAQYVAPAYAAGRTTIQIALTKTGRRVLRHGRSVRVRVGYDFRDLLTARDRGTVTTRLR